MPQATETTGWMKPLRARFESHCPGCLGKIHEKAPIYKVQEQWICRDCYYAARRAGAA